MGRYSKPPNRSPRSCVSRRSRRAEWIRSLAAGTAPATRQARCRRRGATSRADPSHGPDPSIQAAAATGAPAMASRCASSATARPAGSHPPAGVGTSAICIPPASARSRNGRCRPVSETGISPRSVGKMPVRPWFRTARRRATTALEASGGRKRGSARLGARLAWLFFLVGQVAAICRSSARPRPRTGDHRSTMSSRDMAPISQQYSSSSSFTTPAGRARQIARA